MEQTNIHNQKYLPEGNQNVCVRGGAVRVVNKFHVQSNSPLNVFSFVQPLQHFELKAYSTAKAQQVETTDTDKDLGLIIINVFGHTHKQTRGCYQMYYLPCFAVDNYLPSILVSMPPPFRV